MEKFSVKAGAFLLAVIMLLTAMPFSVLAANGVIQQIDVVKIKDATIDIKAGDVPVFTATSAEPELYSTRLDTFERWRDVDTGAYITSSKFYNDRIEPWGDTRLEKFEAGHTYEYSISVQAMDGGSNDFVCTFNENTNISINGTLYDIPSENISLEDYDGVNYLIFFNSVFSVTVSGHTHSYKNVVTKATLTKNGKVVPTCTCGATKAATTISYPKTITLAQTSYTYDGKTKKPSVTVKDSKDNKIATSNYTVSYASGRKNVGKYAVKITFKGNYSGTKTLYFTINPKGTTIASITPASKAITVKWKKQATQTTGYEIQYATDSKFTKNKKTVTVSKNSTTSKKISKLSAKKKYYVRVRTYKTVGKTKYYSTWSPVKNTTTKK